MTELPLVAEVALAGLALALGGTLKGATGAGAPVLAVPVMAMFFGVELAVVIFVVPNFLTNVWQGWHYRAHRTSPRFTWGLALSGCVGVAIGSWLLATVAPRYLLLAVAVMVSVYVAFRLARPHWKLDETWAQRLLWPAGFTGGTLQGATGVSAPVSVTFLNAVGLSRPAFIGTIAVFFATLSAVQIPLLYWLGLMDGPRLLLGLAAVVPLIAFMPFGNWLAQRVSRQTFDRVILALLAVIALRLFWQALAAG